MAAYAHAREVFVSQHGEKGDQEEGNAKDFGDAGEAAKIESCLLYTSDAADEEDSVDLGGRRIIKKVSARASH